MTIRRILVRFLGESGVVRIPLEEAAKNAPLCPGVYKLYLSGRLMRVGRAVKGDGLGWKMRQYWIGSLPLPGPRVREIHASRDKIRVTWTLCPASRCREVQLEQIALAGGAENLPWNDTV